MYRVSNNERVKKSAKLICDGLEKCLDEKPLNKITINDIHEKCFVSRATFYRLFDSIIDVLIYKCDLIFKENTKISDNQCLISKKDKAVYCAQIWLSHPKLIKAIIDNNLIWIIYNTYANHSEELKKVYNIDFVNDTKKDYFFSILSSLLIGSLYIYFKHGCKDNFEDVFDSIRESITIISNSYNS